MNLKKIDTSVIKERLRLSYCSIIKQGIEIDVIGNSIVYASQSFEVLNTIKDFFPSKDISEIKFGFNFVQIQGNMPQGEELHIHVSYLIGIAVEGKGKLIYKKNETVLTELVESGDMFFIPRNAFHYFEGDPVIRFSALEFGPIIDYQKHYYDQVE